MRWHALAGAVIAAVVVGCGPSDSPVSGRDAADDTLVLEVRWPTAPGEVERMLESLPQRQDGWLRSPTSDDGDESWVGWSVEYTRDPDASPGQVPANATAGVTVIRPKPPVHRTDLPVWMLAGLWIWGGCAEADCLDVEASSQYDALVAAASEAEFNRELDRLRQAAATSEPPWIRFTSTYNVDSGEQLRADQYIYAEGWGVLNWTYAVEASSSAGREFVLGSLAAAAEDS
jgi:hypothetical protein